MTSLSPATIGDDTPEGAVTFHFRFLSGPNSTGGFCPSAIPEPAGPRNCGHNCGSPPCARVANNAIVRNAIEVFMSITSVAGNGDSAWSRSIGTIGHRCAQDQHG